MKSKGSLATHLIILLLLSSLFSTLNILIVARIAAATSEEITGHHRSLPNRLSSVRQFKLLALYAGQPKETGLEFKLAKQVLKLAQERAQQLYRPHLNVSIKIRSDSRECNYLNSITSQLVDEYYQSKESSTSAEDNSNDQVLVLHNNNNSNNDLHTHSSNVSNMVVNQYHQDEFSQNSTMNDAIIKGDFSVSLATIEASSSRELPQLGGRFKRQTGGKPMRNDANFASSSTGKHDDSGIESTVQKSARFFQDQRASRQHANDDDDDDEAEEWNAHFDAHSFDAILGPTCDFSLDMIARMASYWQKPIYSSGVMGASFSQKNIYTTLTRLSLPTEKMSKFLMETLKKYNWHHVAILADLSKTHHQIMHKSLEAAISDQRHLYPVYSKLIDLKALVDSDHNRMMMSECKQQLDYNDEEQQQRRHNNIVKSLLQEASYVARVIILIMDNYLYRQLLLVAAQNKQLNMDNGDYAFIGLDLGRSVWGASGCPRDNLAVEAPAAMQQNKKNKQLDISTREALEDYVMSLRRPGVAAKQSYRSNSLTWHDPDDSAHNEQAQRMFQSLLVLTVRTPLSQDYEVFVEQVLRMANEDGECDDQAPTITNQSQVNSSAHTLTQHYPSKHLCNTERAPEKLTREQVNNAAVLLYDALLLAVEAHNRTLADSHYERDNRDAKINYNSTGGNKLLWNSSYTLGLTSNLFINANGDYELDCIMLDMEPETGVMRPVASYDADRNSISMMPRTFVHWPQRVSGATEAGANSIFNLLFYATTGKTTSTTTTTTTATNSSGAARSSIAASGTTGSDTAPPDVPECGFRNDSEQCVDRRDTYVILGTSFVLIAIIICISLLSLWRYRKVKYQLQLNDYWWQIDWKDLVFIHSDHSGAHSKLVDSLAGSTVAPSIVTEALHVPASAFAAASQAAAAAAPTLAPGDNHCFQSAHDADHHQELQALTPNGVASGLEGVAAVSEHQRRRRQQQHHQGIASTASFLNVPSSIQGGGGCTTTFGRDKASSVVSSTHTGASGHSYDSGASGASGPNQQHSVGGQYLLGCGRGLSASGDNSCLMIRSENSYATVAGGVGLALYNNQVVCVKQLNVEKIEISREFLIELKAIRELVHDNLVKFVGLCLEPQHNCVINEYCSKGSLQDMLLNDSLAMDWTFKYSIIGDIINGMNFIHTSLLDYHGRLKSSNCTIDSRFTVKITDFGLHKLYKQTLAATDCDNDNNIDHSAALKKNLSQHDRAGSSVGQVDSLRGDHQRQVDCTATCGNFYFSNDHATNKESENQRDQQQQQHDDDALSIIGDSASRIVPADLGGSGQQVPVGGVAGCNIVFSSSDNCNNGGKIGANSSFNATAGSKRYLWIAPEHLRRRYPHLEGSKKGDVYSFAIILSEIITRARPYSYGTNITFAASAAAAASATAASSAVGLTATAGAINCKQSSLGKQHIAEEVDDQLSSLSATKLMTNRKKTTTKSNKFLASQRHNSVGAEEESATGALGACNTSIAGSVQSISSSWGTSNPLTHSESHYGSSNTIKAAPGATIINGAAIGSGENHLKSQQQGAASVIDLRRALQKSVNIAESQLVELDENGGEFELENNSIYTDHSTASHRRSEGQTRQVHHQRQHQRQQQQQQRSEDDLTSVSLQSHQLMSPASADVNSNSRMNTGMHSARGAAHQSIVSGSSPSIKQVSRAKPLAMDMKASTRRFDYTNNNNNTSNQAPYSNSSTSRGSGQGVETSNNNNGSMRKSININTVASVFKPTNLEASLDYDEILDQLRMGTSPPVRPAVPTEGSCFSAQQELLDLMELCWSEAPAKRPTFGQIKQRLKRVTNGLTTKNYLDNMMDRLQNYAANLERIVEEKSAAIVEEKRRNEEILYKLMPKFVADQLKRNDTIEPQSFESVTIFFSDIVGFEQFASMMRPTQVVELLNELYARFESIINSFDVVKIETIVDQFLVASGISFLRHSQQQVLAGSPLQQQHQQQQQQQQQLQLDAGGDADQPAGQTGGVTTGDAWTSDEQQRQEQALHCESKTAKLRRVLMRKNNRAQFKGAGSRDSTIGGGGARSTGAAGSARAQQWRRQRTSVNSVRSLAGILNSMHQQQSTTVDSGLAEGDGQLNRSLQQFSSVGELPLAPSDSNSNTGNNGNSNIGKRMVAAAGASASMSLDTITNGNDIDNRLKEHNRRISAEQIARMALCIRDSVKSFQFQHASNIMFNVRIGIHSGSVCAGVVGLKRPKYCLIGDTVNVASRMQTNGKANKIQMSQQTKSLLNNVQGFIIEPRGTIDIKGKGLMDTYWLESASSL